MRKENLVIAIDIKKEIDELEDFIAHAEKVWTGKLIRREYRYLFMSNRYGIIRYYK